MTATPAQDDRADADTALDGTSLIPSVPDTGTLRGDLRALLAHCAQPLTAPERTAASLLAGAGHDRTAHAALDTAVVGPLSATVATIAQRHVQRGHDLSSTQRQLARTLVQALWWDRYLTGLPAHGAGQVDDLVDHVLLPVLDDRPAAPHPVADDAVGGPATLRRAVAYIDADPARPMTLAQIAAAAGTSARALQYSFRRHHDTTPLGYLRRVRLQRAHRELQIADPAGGATVAGIASSWGFHAPDRFAAAYRRAFGVPPRTTLHS
jgi:AraC-like DNA-binding protein